MRRRLLLVVLGLLAGSLAAFAIPQGVTFAERASQDAFITQLTDTTRFATLAESALRDDRSDALAFELRRHDQLYGVAVMVVDADGRVVVRSRATIRPEDPEVADALAMALGGSPTEKPHTVWPWDTRPYVVAEPAGRDSQVVGAVVTVAPTDAVRAAIQRRFLALVARFLSLVLLAGLLLGLPLVRWVLRPVDRLAVAARGIAEGRFDARVLSSGPPELRRLADAFNTMAG
ncbi:MAG TPA: HAMP domain-containing protein, partial [Cryptosporangiaceae bacterium]|nr:HAMP domain-containing protein [Cryptosporangiaceae bacterium]